MPAAVDEVGGFANFRETATKTNSLINRLKTIKLPDIEDVVDGLENYLQTKERAAELDAKSSRQTGRDYCANLGPTRSQPPPEVVRSHLEPRFRWSDRILIAACAPAEYGSSV